MRTKQTGRKAEVPEPTPQQVIARKRFMVDGIKSDIGEFLDGIESGCSFATFGVLSEAPLPDLNLRAYGPIPLPLALRDVYGICDNKKKGDDTGSAPLAVKSVHGGSALLGQWEMTYNNVRMCNPAWDGFIQKIAVRAARDLGVESDAGAVEAKLVRARLWTVGACMPSHQIVPNTINSFGKLLVCLPAGHMGGNLLLSYDGKTKKFITETSSNWGYSYIAWYPDVSVKLKPVDAGYRLMIEYDLILPSPSKLPSLADIYSGKGKFRDNLAAWNSGVKKESKTEDSCFPTLLAHICDTTYESKSLSFDVLQGNDRFRAAYLKDLCATLDVGLYIANLDRTLEGDCEDFCHGADYFMSDENEDSIVLTKIFDLDGNTVGDDVALEVDDNFVASDPFEDLPDNKDVDLHHALVTHYWRKTVLVMIPSVAKADWLSIESEEDRPNKRQRTA